MASLPETATLPDNIIMGSPPPSPPSPAPPFHGNPSLPSDTPPEPSPPDHATPIPPLSPGQAPSSFSSLELVTSAASPALEATAAGRPSSRSLLPPTEAVEFYPEAASSPSSSYETADASPASPPPTPPPLVLCASPDSYFTEPAEMASPEREPMGADEGSTAPEPPTPPLESGPDASFTAPAAMASPARDPMGADEGSHTAPEPPTPPLESGPEGFQQQPHPPPTTSPECDSSEPAELPFPPTSSAEIAHTLPNAAEVDAVAGTTEEAPGSTAAVEVTDAAEIDAVAGTLEQAPGSTAAMKVRDATEIDAVARTPEEAPGSTVAMEVTYGETGTAAVSVSPVLESREEGSLQESMEKPSSPTMNAEPGSMWRPSSPTMDTEPCSPEMAPLGFQQQQQQPHPLPTTPSEWDSSEPAELPLPPTSPAEVAHTLPHAAEVDVVAVTPEETPGSTVAMEVTHGEIDTTVVSVPPVLESGEEGSLQESMQRPSSPAKNTEPESMQRPSSPTMDTEPCSPVMATPGFQQQQQQPHPPPTTSPECDDSEHVELLLPPASLAEIAHTLPDAVKINVVAGTPEEAPGSTLAMAVTYWETDTAAVSVPSVVESGEEGSLQESMQRPSSPTMVTESCSLEMAPPGFEICIASWLPVPPPTPAGESISSLPVAAAPKGLVVMPEEAVDSVPSSEALDAEKPSSIMQAEPSSPDMPPPGFENFKSSRLQLPTTPPPVETNDVLPDVVVTKAVESPIEEVSRPWPALEVTNMETDTVLNISPTEETEGLLQQPPLKPPSPVERSEPCSQDEMAPPGFEYFKSSSEPCSAEEMAPPAFDNFKSSSESCSPEEMAPPGFENLKSSSEPCLPEEMAPPGFENFKLSWPPLPTLPHTAFVLPDGAAPDALAVTVEEAAGPPPAIEVMDVDMDAIHPPPLPFDSGVEESLQEPLPRVASPIMQESSCSPDRAPPGFETYKSSQLLLPSLSLAQTTNVQQDQLVTEAVSVIEEAPQPLHSVEVMGANMNAAPPLLLSSESGPDGPCPQQLPRLPSSAEKGTTTCLPDMVHSGCDDLKPSQLLPLPAVISPVQTPDGLADAPAVDRIAVASEESPHRLLVSGGMEDGTVPIQSPPLENASEGSLPQVESQAHSPTAQAADSLLDAPGLKSVTVTSEEISQPPLASQATNTDLVSTTTMQPQSEGIVDESLQPQHPPSSTAHAAPCLQDSVPLVPPPPSPFLNKEIGQMVCGSCRVLLAYFRGAGHVHCTCCHTMNLVLEASYLCMVVCPPMFVAAHEVGNVHCGRCETLLMYPFGAPAVKCSLCLFVTEIGERNVRPRLSKPDQAVAPHPPELTHQG